MIPADDLRSTGRARSLGPYPRIEEAVRKVNDQIDDNHNYGEIKR
jgi:hypothetical protein